LDVKNPIQSFLSTVFTPDQVALTIMLCVGVVDDTDNVIGNEAPTVITCDAVQVYPLLRQKNRMYLPAKDGVVITTEPVGSGANPLFTVPP
jgi:hypothetical protein